MRSIYLILPASLLTLAAACSKDAEPEYMRPNPPESSEILSGYKVGKDVIAAPEEFGFADAAKSPFNIAWALVYGPQAGYDEYTWHFEPLLQGELYASFQDTAPFAPTICFETRLDSPDYLEPDLSHPAIQTPDGKRVWNPEDYRGAIVKGAGNALYLIAETADEANPLLLHPMPYAPSRDDCQPTPDDTPVDIFPGSWQRNLKATYHYEGDSKALIGYSDFETLATARFDFDVNRYYVYDKVFNPPYNDGLGLRYNATRGDNDIIVTTLQTSPDESGTTHPIRVHLLIYLP